MSDFFDDTAAARASDDIAHAHAYLDDEVQTIPMAWMVVTLAGVLLLAALLGLAGK